MLEVLMTGESKSTTLNDWHRASGANMADFGGYDMPLWYPAGARAEHLAVITGAGLFDTSHMAVVTLEGRDSRRLLQHCFTRDLDPPPGSVAPLAEGRCVYGAFLDEGGGVIDDAIVYQTGATAYMVVVNAGMGGTIAAHLESHVDGEVHITDHQ
jgi:aminomethyltransferase